MHEILSRRTKIRLSRAIKFVTNTLCRVDQPLCMLKLFNGMYWMQRYVLSVYLDVKYVYVTIYQGQNHNYMFRSSKNKGTNWPTLNQLQIIGQPSRNLWSNWEFLMNSFNWQHNKHCSSLQISCRLWQYLTRPKRPRKMLFSAWFISIWYVWCSSKW